jgi:hypothetical protein
MSNFIANNSTVILFVGLYMAVGLIAHLPEPGDPRPIGEKLYQTFYDTCRVLANMAVERNPKLAGAAVTITPATETIIRTPTTVSTSDPTQIKEK